MEELENVLAIPREEVILASAKEGTGVDEILEAIVAARAAAARATRRRRSRALIFDSHYDAYKGVVAYVRLAEGTLHDHEHGPADGTRAPRAEILELGVFRPQLVPVDAARGGRGRLRRDGPQERPRRPGRRHDHRRRRAGRRAAARLPAGQAARLRRASTRSAARTTRSCATRWRSCTSTTPRSRYEPESSVALGLRLPLRLPGPAPHGDRPGAAGARVRPRPDRLGAVRRVPGRAAPTGAARSSSTTRRALPDRRRDRGDPRAVGASVNVITPSDVHRAAHGAGRPTAAALRGHGVPRPAARAACTSSCRWPS